MDEVNSCFEGLTKEQTDAIIEGTKLPIKGAHVMLSYKMKMWDGKESFFTDDGFCYLAMIPDILKILEKEFKIKKDKIEFIDERLPFPYDDSDVEIVDEAFLKNEFGFDLYDYQVEAINKAVSQKKAMMEISTSGGKSLICIGICKVLNKKIKIFIATPSDYLTNQFVESFEKTDLRYINLSKVKPKDREKAIEENDFIILSHKLLLNVSNIIDDKQYGIIYDEGHLFGDKMSDAFRMEMRNFPVRILMTGTLPPDKQKLEKIKNSIGGEKIINVRAREIIDMGIASHIDITIIGTNDKTIKEESTDSEMWEWDIELEYLTTNVKRVDAIARYIQSLPKKNTLIVCRPEFGSRLSKFFNNRMIQDETKTETREEWLKEFETRDDDYYLCASFGTTATGISINNIQRVISIDAGNYQEVIKQTIGRGMRKDGKSNECEYIDIYADTKIGNKQMKKREKLYKSEEHPIKNLGSIIKIGE